MSKGIEMIQKKRKCGSNVGTRDAETATRPKRDNGRAYAMCTVKSEAKRDKSCREEEKEDLVFWSILHNCKDRTHCMHDQDQLYIDIV
jgi:hypothetical protein